MLLTSVAREVVIAAQLALAQPGLLGGFLGRVSGGDLRIDFAGVGSPVADSGVQASADPGRGSKIPAASVA